MLTSEIAAVQDSKIVTNLHGSALDLLLSIVEIERDLKHLIAKRNKTNAISVLSNLQTQQDTKTISNDISAQEKIDEEIKKVKRKLPRWAKNPDQINSQILIHFLTLQQVNQSTRISESELKEAYGNDYEFFRNFNQMKTIAPKNHAKVFHVRNGLIEIWEPVKRAVEIFKGKVQPFLRPELLLENKT